MPVSVAWFAQTPGEAVGLQLLAHRRALLALLIAAAGAQRAFEVLHVVAVLVRQHVRRREVAALRAEALRGGRRRS